MTPKNLISLTLTLALTSLIAVSSMAATMPIAELSAALRTDGALITIGDAMADGKTGQMMKQFLGAAGLSANEITEATHSPAAARAALSRAMEAAALNPKLQAQARALVGVTLHMNDIAETLRTQRAAVAKSGPSTSTTAVASPFGHTSTGGSPWSMTSSTTAAKGTAVSTSGTVGANIESITKMAREHSGTVDPSVTSRFIQTAEANPALVSEFVLNVQDPTSGFLGRCGNMDPEALKNYESLIADTVIGTVDGQVPAIAARNSLMARTNVDADEADANLCHLSTACNLIGGRAVPSSCGTMASIQ